MTGGPILVVAAGGIFDGRGLAMALSLVVAPTSVDSGAVAALLVLSPALLVPTAEPDHGVA